MQKSAIGIGTVIGSEIFNHMCISAGSGYFAKGGVLQLNKYQFSRDCFAYFVALSVFMWSTGAKFENAFIQTEWGHCLQVSILSSGVLVLCQMIYCVVVAKFLDILKALSIEENDIRLTVRLTCGGMERPTMHSYRGSMKARLLNTEPSSTLPTTQDDDRDTLAPYDEDDELRMTNRDTITMFNELEEREKSLYSASDSSTGPMGCISTAIQMFLHPLQVVIEWTIPNVREEAWESYYGIAIFICIGWLAVFAYALCECLTVLGVWLNIPSVVMGLTFSAIGTSFPNLWCSLVVAKNGQGDMAVSNALGSNTFNIFIALGLPWFCYTAINDSSYEKLQDGGIVYLSLMLLTVLVGYYLTIMAHGWKIHSW